MKGRFYFQTSLLKACVYLGCLRHAIHITSRWSKLGISDLVTVSLGPRGVLVSKYDYMKKCIGLTMPTQAARAELS